MSNQFEKKRKSLIIIISNQHMAGYPDKNFETINLRWNVGEKIMQVPKV